MEEAIVFTQHNGEREREELEKYMYILSLEKKNFSSLNAKVCIFVSMSLVPIVNKYFLFF